MKYTMRQWLIKHQHFRCSRYFTEVEMKSGDFTGANNNIIEKLLKYCYCILYIIYTIYI